ncbi:MAG: hydroxyacid dehydrogenase [Bdellovibrionota bacterium]
MKFKVLATDGMDQIAAEALKKNSYFELEVRKETPREEFHAIAKSADFIILRSATKIKAADFEALPNLKGVIRAGVGIDNVDLEAAKKSGVYVWNAPTGNFLATAEHAIALTFSLLRAIPFSHSASRLGVWAKKEASSLGRQIQGTYLGLYGCGNIGSRVVKIASAAGMKVGIFDPYLKVTPEGAELLSADELLSKSDVITIHTPMTSETKGFFNYDRMMKMKKGSYLVNAARGGIIVEADLLRALQEGHLAAAALDVYETEPFSFDNPMSKALLEHPRVIATPHIAASTREAQAAVGMECVEKLSAIAAAVTEKNEALMPKFLAAGSFSKLST